MIAGCAAGNDAKLAVIGEELRLAQVRGETEKRSRIS